ncbi:hypothetical protein DICPUDRAFT_158809 [Dictyostelium purpureum]|uniref:Uncharacterized protein n=1 Tax=Dictyostelium purpureum TaxID=5786 RepID=F1A2J6_DICPU|nr:uncharacterized protein DICPUDRAFT_158809 [Dictyostelium purpureum]EGC29589.1 hypothetical protein DICPUDRAFT_158809 [Dictyostelium purpureum]|eukprot:XP_003293891.1 hypothetical protein DICPUDRAFT_158809 [Dictyostelium purpureum]
MILVNQDEPVHFELEEDFEIEYPKSKYGWATHRIPFTKKQWFYLAVFQGAGNFVLNFFLNLFLTWVMYPKTEGYYISFSSKFTECIFTDIVVTSFVLPFLTNLALSFLCTLDLRKGKVQPIDERWLNHPLFRQIPTGIFWKKVLKRGLYVGIICCFVVSFITLIPIYIATGKDGMLVKWPYCIFKAFFCATYAALISPTIAFILMASFNPRHTFFENHK